MSGRLEFQAACKQAFLIYNKTGKEQIYICGNMPVIPEFKI